MADMNQYNGKILYLATAYRNGFSEEDNSTFRSQNTCVKIENASHQESCSDQYRFPGIINEDAEKRQNVSEQYKCTEKFIFPGAEVPKNLFEADVTEWNQAFSELRPPLLTTKRKQLQPVLRFTNRSCEEILHVTGSYREYLESEKEQKGNWEVKREEIERVNHLWDTEGGEHSGDSESESLERIGESSETPIPRNLMRFPP